MLDLSNGIWGWLPAIRCEAARIVVTVSGSANGLRKVTLFHVNQCNQRGSNILGPCGKRRSVEALNAAASAIC
jgi:hypothetical protein